MKIARFVLKIVAFSLIAAAAVCAVIAYWDKLTALFQPIAGKLEEKKACVCKAEFDDYAE